MITEAGLLGILALVVILLAVYRSFLSHGKYEELYQLTDLENGVKASLVLLLVIFTFFSTTPVTTVLLFLLLALGANSRNVSFNLSAQDSKLPAGIVTFPVIALLVAFSYFGFRALSAERDLAKALNALVANNGSLTYDLMRNAIRKNPYVDRYHASYTQEQQGQAIKDAKALENISTVKGVKVVREETDGESGETKENNIYASSNLADEQPKGAQEARLARQNAPAAAKSPAKKPKSKDKKPGKNMKSGKNIPVHVEEYDPDAADKMTFSFFRLIVRLLMVVLFSAIIAATVSGLGGIWLGETEFRASTQNKILNGLFFGLRPLRPNELSNCACARGNGNGM